MARGVCAVHRNFVFYLCPKGWGLVICHGSENAAFVRRIVRGETGRKTPSVERCRMAPWMDCFASYAGG